MLAASTNNHLLGLCKSLFLRLVNYLFSNLVLGDSRVCGDLILDSILLDVVRLVRCRSQELFHVNFLSELRGFGCFAGY